MGADLTKGRFWPDKARTTRASITRGMTPGAVTKAAKAGFEAHDQAAACFKIPLTRSGQELSVPAEQSRSWPAMIGR